MTILYTSEKGIGTLKCGKVTFHGGARSRSVSLRNTRADQRVLFQSVLAQSRQLLRFCDPLDENAPDIAEQAPQDVVFGAARDGKVEFEIHLDKGTAAPGQA